MRVYFAEFLGTLVLVLWGEGTQAQVVAARKQPSDYLSVAWGWGVGFMLAIYISSGISGGHINPAVTVSLAVFRRFKWRKVPGYILAQLLGAFTAAAIIYGVYYGPLHSLKGGYAGVMTTGPADLVPSTASAFFSVFMGAALLMGSISAFTDTGNNPATPGLTPLLLGIVMVGIASSFGYQTGFVLNPARDLGPRLLVWATGSGGRALWLDNTAYGIWIPTVGTITGACFGNLLYDLLIYNGRDSPLNANFSRRAKRARAQRLQYEREQEKLGGDRGYEHEQQAMGGAAPAKGRFSGSTFDGGRAEEAHGRVHGGKQY
ncbi:aquaporin-like protein [Leucosporidium creatinivorum]|uniref:Aquaporin-like protein n=1 Tax=Leucosporidium creatinivorum TaxID=106004 RepID=A0A1Y2FL78_9BASI|nr:aquaporin-like protein [Leucosporidium creatinivorum]